jgi:secretion/DNA translocation related TadE-like protein
MRNFPDRAEAGVATVWMLAWMALLLMVAAVVVLVAQVTARQHRLDAAADLAALAGAGHQQRGLDVCAAAGRSAAANGAVLRDCTVTGDDVVVVVTASLELPFGLRPTLQARARAGPVS